MARATSLVIPLFCGALFLTGCVESPGPSSSTPTEQLAESVGPVWQLPPEEPDAHFSVEVSAELDHSLSLRDAAALADDLGITVVRYRFSNHNAYGELHIRDDLDTTLARFFDRYQTEPNVIALVFDFRVPDPTDPFGYPRIPTIPTGQDEDFDPPAPVVG